MEPNLPSYVYWLIILLTLWTLPWKGYALWTAAKRREKIWFIALFLVNSAAILEIIYLFFVVPRKKENQE